MTRRILAAVAAATLLGCTTPPATVTVERCTTTESRWFGETTTCRTVEEPAP